MKVPFASSDFSERAALVYPQRTGVVDEPGEAQDGGLGTLTYAQLMERAHALAASLDSPRLIPNRRQRHGRREQRRSGRPKLGRRRRGARPRHN